MTNDLNNIRQELEKVLVECSVTNEGFPYSYIEDTKVVEKIMPVIESTIRRVTEEHHRDVEASVLFPLDHRIKTLTSLKLFDKDTKCRIEELVSTRRKIYGYLYRNRPKKLLGSDKEGK